MTAPTRLGDLIRVVHALDPDPDDLVLIGQLLTGPGGPAPAPRPRRPRARDDDVAPPADEPSRPWRPAPTGRASRALRTTRRRPGSEWQREAAAWERAWWATVIALVALLATLRVSGQIGGAAWLVLAVGIVGLRPAQELAARSWSMWWRSAQRHSTATRDDRGNGGERRADDAGVLLARAGWQAPPAAAPLVPRRQQRAVATLLAGRTVPGEIDLVATVDRVAARQPLDEVPHRPRWSTRLGVHLHVDVGPALEPFRQDVARLRRSLVAVASAHGVVELGFDGDPGYITRPRRLAGAGGGLPLTDRLPAPGTPVLVVTDLGIAVPRTGSPGEPEDFLLHHQLLTRVGCPVHYLVPYPPRRWPAPLRGLPAVYWSDHLSAVEVLTALRRRPRTA